ncbi:MAG: hypothetical protein QE285_03045 [Aquabacterium sp.]|nr:hypothetical protein [Aquabacterium sp.]
MRLSFFAVAALAGAAGADLRAAPLDALVSALPPTAATRWAVEIGYDAANRQLDVLGMRPRRADGSDGPSGDYSGGHLQVGVAATPTLRLEGAVWKRNIAYVSTLADVTTWQLAGQWQMLTSANGERALALRAGAFGSHTPLLRRTTSTRVQGVTFTSAQVTNPRDLQLQLDLVASMRLAPALTLSAFAGAGRSQVDFDAVRATTRSKDGCQFDVSFEGGKVVAVCENNGSTIRVSTPASVYGIDVAKEARYTATSLQLGANLGWQPGDWRLRAGLQAMQIDRGSVDDIVQQRGGKVFRSNTVGVLDVGYRLLPSSLVFLRAQVLAHQFVGEVPLMYNSLTATQHRRRYGIATLGVAHSF